MVRFIIPDIYKMSSEIYIFTFQYGQIYYYQTCPPFSRGGYIYIPIWLDLLLDNRNYQIVDNTDLHSNMVRFIISNYQTPFFLSDAFTFQYGQIYYFHTCQPFFFSFSIYIPIWLDLLFNIFDCIFSCFRYLHSNMVRFIICFSNDTEIFTSKFTFQYGQIYYYA